MGESFDASQDGACVRDEGAVFAHAVDCGSGVVIDEAETFEASEV